MTLTVAIIAPGNLVFYNGTMFPQWKGSALISEHGRTWEHDGADGIAYGLARQLDDVDRAIGMTERLIEAKAGPGGDDPFNFVSLSGLQVLRGDLDAAETSALAAVEGYAHEGADVFPSWRLRGIALVAAHRGRLDEAERLSTEGLELSMASGDLVLEVYHRHILGFVALSRGDAAGALAQLTQAAAAADASGTRGLFLRKPAGKPLSVYVPRSAVL